MAYINGNDVAYGVTNLNDGDVTDAYTKAETDVLLNGKEDKINKVNSFGGQSQTGDDEHFPTVKATRDYVDAKIADFEDDYDGQLDDIDEAKADKSDTYTKTEVDAAIQEAIGGVENGAY